VKKPLESRLKEDQLFDERRGTSVPNWRRYDSPTALGGRVLYGKEMKTQWSLISFEGKQRKSIVSIALQYVCRVG